MKGICSIALAIIVLALSGTANSEAPARIDSSTDATAQSSWDKMLAQSNDETKCRLRAALVQLNTAAAVEKGLSGFAFHAAVQDPLIALVKEKVSGLSAEQVIELGQQLSQGQVNCGQGKA